jgi:hypothetical protein
MKYSVAFAGFEQTIELMKKGGNVNGIVWSRPPDKCLDSVQSHRNH